MAAAARGRRTVPGAALGGASAAAVRGRRETGDGERGASRRGVGTAAGEVVAESSVLRSAPFARKAVKLRDSSEGQN